MRKMTIEDFDNLKHGDKIHKIIYGKYRELRFVGIMPSCKQYLIFSDGEHLEYFYRKNNIEVYYIGEYDKIYIKNILIEYHTRQIEIIKEVYNDKKIYIKRN